MIHYWLLRLTPLLEAPHRCVVACANRVGQEGGESPPLSFAPPPPFLSGLLALHVGMLTPDDRDRLWRLVVRAASWWTRCEGEGMDVRGRGAARGRPMTSLWPRFSAQLRWSSQSNVRARKRHDY
jgi:hypothetical protein